MKKFLLVFAFSFCILRLFAGDDRFGNHRAEIMRSSFSAGAFATQGVVLASATEVDSLNISSSTIVRAGQLYIRRVVFSGVNASTLTFYDFGTLSAPNISTKSIISYVPSIGLGGVTGAGAIDVDLYFSSAILVVKDCAGPPCFSTVNWDYLTPPRTAVGN